MIRRGAKVNIKMRANRKKFNLLLDESLESLSFICSCCCSNEYRWTCEGIHSWWFTFSFSNSAINTNLRCYFFFCFSHARLVRGTKRLVKYNFMDDCKYWSPLETSRMLNPCECQFLTWWSMLAFVSTCRRRNRFWPETSDGKKIISDRLALYDYYRPSLNNQKVTVASFDIRFLISLTAFDCFCFLFSLSKASIAGGRAANGATCIFHEIEMCE